MLDVRISPDPVMLRLLSNHPRVASVTEQSQESALAWDSRQIFADRPNVELRGIVELIDNNPLVCADEFSLPGPAATLALIALGPLARAGLVAEDPTMLSNIDAPTLEITPYLSAMGWDGGFIAAFEERDLAGVFSAAVLVPIFTPDRLEEIDDLFAETYGASFFVHEEDASDWHVDLVRGKSHAAYRLRISPDEPQSLLTVQVMADANGKCGAAQVVHAFNVMCGFEESLGIVQTN